MAMTRPRKATEDRDRLRALAHMPQERARAAKLLLIETAVAYIAADGPVRALLADRMAEVLPDLVAIGDGPLYDIRQAAETHIYRPDRDSLGHLKHALLLYFVDRSDTHLDHWRALAPRPGEA